MSAPARGGYGPFDPLGGGAWNLEVTGTIEGTTVDVAFPVIFPAYPRIGIAAPQAAGAQAPAEQGSGSSPWAVPAAVMALGLVLLPLAGYRHRTGARRSLASEAG